MIPPPIYVILDTQYAAPPFESLIGTIARTGVGWVQLREKTASSRIFFERARSFVASCHQHGLTAFINDRVDIASLTDADGVHLGQEDLPVEVARQLLGPGKIIGYSTHNRRQALEAERSSADYVAIGPAYPTASKQNPDPVVSSEELKIIRALVSKPLVAIGGITLENGYPLWFEHHHRSRHPRHPPVRQRGTPHPSVSRPGSFRIGKIHI
ncbi:MAG: thiamine phosphate synthase [Terriglobia bacterium]